MSQSSLFLDTQIVPLLASRRLFKLVASPFELTLINSDNFFAFYYDKIFKTLLVFLAPDLESVTFLSGLGVSSLFFKL